MCNTTFLKEKPDTGVLSPCQRVSRLVYIIDLAHKKNFWKTSNPLKNSWGSKLVGSEQWSLDKICEDQTLKHYKKCRSF